MNPKILEKMGFKPTSHNEIFLDHLECIADFLKAQCPIEKKKALAMLRGSTGISNRYVREHIESLLAWNIIRSHAGNYEWIFDIQEQEVKKSNDYTQWSKIHDETLANEPIKPCRYRPLSGECNPLPNKFVKISAQNCNPCTIREEA